MISWCISSSALSLLQAVSHLRGCSVLRSCLVCSEWVAVLRHAQQGFVVYRPGLRYWHEKDSETVWPAIMSDLSLPRMLLIYFPVNYSMPPYDFNVSGTISAVAIALFVPVFRSYQLLPESRPRNAAISISEASRDFSG